MGGNAFKDEEKTFPIEKKYVESTLKNFLNQVLRKSGIDEFVPLGSTGKKELSGDLDIAIYAPDNSLSTRKNISKEFENILGPQNVKLAGSIIITRFPIADKSGNKVQIDVMITTDKDLKNTEWLMAGTGSGVKGVFRNILLSHIAKYNSEKSDEYKFTLSFPGGLNVKNKKGELLNVITNKQKILKTLGLNFSTKDAESYESLVNTLIKLKMWDLLDGFKDYLLSSKNCSSNENECQKALQFLESKINENIKRKLVFLINEMKEESTLKVDREGNKRWKNSMGELHRLDGPAAEYTDGTKIWYMNGKLHRLDGPAIEHVSGTKEWWMNGQLHRLGAPAAEHSSGTKEWYVKGQRHRLDGPAIEWSNGTKEWWINGKKTSQRKILLLQKILNHKKGKK